jgi:hypothetical protein
LHELVPHVAKSELALFDAFHHVLLLLSANDVLHLRHQALDITEAEQPLDEAGRLKLFEVVKVLSCTDEDDRTLGGSDC